MGKGSHYWGSLKIPLMLFFYKARDVFEVDLQSTPVSWFISPLNGILQMGLE